MCVWGLFPRFLRSCNDNSLHQHRRSETFPLDKNIQKRILEKLEFYCSQDQPLHFAEPLVHSQFGKWRFRVGGYRVLFDVEAEEIVVLAVGHRREVYR